MATGNNDAIAEAAKRAAGAGRMQSMAGTPGVEEKDRGAGTPDAGVRGGARVAHFPTAGSLPLPTARVGFRIERFGACSAFTRVVACVVAEPPEAALCHRSASDDVVTSIIRSDCYRLERQLPGGVRTR